MPDFKSQKTMSHKQHSCGAALFRWKWMSGTSLTTGPHTERRPPKGGRHPGPTTELLSGQGMAGKRKKMSSRKINTARKVAGSSPARDVSPFRPRSQR